MKPIVMKILPKFGLSSRSGGKYSHGGTARQSRLGYQLDHMSRQTQCGPNHTQIDAAGKDDDSSTEGGNYRYRGSRRALRLRRRLRFDGMILRRRRRMGVVPRVSCNDTNEGRGFLLR
jgi:hypothetical protein